jgi:signal transduction histidine kinase
MAVGETTKDLRRVHAQAANILLLNSVLSLLGAPAVFVVLLLVFQVDMLVAAIAGMAAALTVILINAFWLSRVIARPFAVLQQAVSHITPESVGVTPPEPEKLSFGREATIQLVKSVYSLFETARKLAEPQDDKGNVIVLKSTLVDKFNFPILAVNAEGNVVYANANALALIDRHIEDVLSKPLDAVLPLRQRNDPVVMSWLASCRLEKIKESRSWQDIRFTNVQHREYSFDIYADFSRDDSSGADMVLMLIDRTSEREYDDMKVDFVALAAHELRAPITVIRGYMEVFEEEVGPKLSQEHRQFLTKMKVSGAQLAGFIGNILNASRVDRGRLNMHFERGAWSDILRDAVDNMSLQADALGRKIELTVEDHLPEIFVDHVSIVEVINNLIDNAIKYSPVGSTITVAAKLGDNGGIQTDVIDHGIGIPPNLLGKLFSKFYRSHRSRQQFNGTGLGLYLSKAIIESHHGNIWANSKEGEGSTFSIWLPPAEQVANQLGTQDNKLEGITRGSHGWIKNHSLYRR